ncbi:uncharacterized protein BP5553_03906 [Venustampulla echinocandica]|uniref:DUF1264-domain-containing protein n=1 Tax=Venustampulla echinocandica TaxID=2656787 RepID=A0A370TVL0_9HELO|nr:uncharacterized protein BP5553_03906 [Venustampulla echinocandica]RDL39566.1 hypothetical protein BP5553_03906 [Venustampulla echinocandica]
MASQTTYGAPGPEPTAKDKVLETGAAATQSFGPIKAICAHLNAFHLYASDMSRPVEANHYCTHLSADVRQCLIYNAPSNPARLIGVEYMITQRLYDALDEEEKKLWHDHHYEVSSGMLIMPNSNVPEALWEKAETAEMKEVKGLWGKTYHFWQVDRGDTLPLGKPELMMSATKDGQLTVAVDQPAKRRAPALAEAPSAPKPRQSKLAKEHNITSVEENEIREAFTLFSKPKKGEKEGIIPVGDVRRAMIALDIVPTPNELEEFISILDPDEEGFAEYEPFVAICALKFHARDRTSDSHTQEVDEAFKLFTSSGGEGKITIATLRSIANALKEDVDDELLRDMIIEANGGAGVGKGVEKAEFEEVMRRAGVWR